MNAGTELPERITVRADVFGGKPVIRGMRIAVEHVLAMLSAGDIINNTAEPFLRASNTPSARCLTDPRIDVSIGKVERGGAFLNTRKEENEGCSQ